MIIVAYLIHPHLHGTRATKVAKAHSNILSVTAMITTGVDQLTI
ncbi:hypothetical protein A2U01_0102026, partial [Trifolium medium]|nr:hypothetical protein [Trifolium medium]